MLQAQLYLHMTWAGGVDNDLSAYIATGSFIFLVVAAATCLTVHGYEGTTKLARGMQSSL